MRETTWFERDPGRYKREIEAVLAAFPCVCLTVAERRVGWEGRVEVRGQLVPVRLDYPPDFPSRPPEVRETQAFAPEAIIDHRATHHQFVGGGLCLYTKGYGARSWRRELTAADVLRRFVEFIEAKLDGLHVKECYTEAETLPGVKGDLRVLLPPVLAEIMTLPGGKGSFVGRFYPQQKVLRTVSARDQHSGVEESHNDPAFSGMGPGTELRGLWGHVGKVEGTWREAIPTLASATELVRTACPPIEGEQGSNPLILLSRASDHRDTDGFVAMELASPSKQGPQLTSAVVEVLNASAALSTRSELFTDDLEALGQWRIVMIGLGSLGSAVALALAKAGLRRFLLFDPDVLRPENIWRHQGDLTGLFFPKVLVVKALIERRQPTADVVPVAYSPLWDSSGGGVVGNHLFLEALRQPRTLVITTAAEAEVEHPVNEMLVAQRVPGIYASVLGRAEHGRVFRVLPGVTPCYECIRLAQEGMPARFPQLGPPDDTQPGSADGYRQPGIPGLGMDIEALALTTARFALQTLGALEPGMLTYPPAGGDHLLTSHHGGWIFDTPMAHRWEPYTRAPGCAICGELRGDAPMSPEAEAELRQLIREAKAVERWAPGGASGIVGGQETSGPSGEAEEERGG